MPEEGRPRYDVVLSFAGEDRPYVEEVASLLRDSGVNIFYDSYEQVSLWGKDLYSHLDDVYRKASRYCVLFISSAYAAKVWTNHERQSAQARALEENTEYVLPARFDDTEIPGLRPSIAYLNLSDIEPPKLASMIIEKLGPRQVQAGFPSEIGRLLKSLGQKNAKPKNKSRTYDVAYSFYDAMRRMSEDERRAVGGLFAFGCPAELPDGVHISLDFLSRMTGLSSVEILEHLASVRPLNIKTKTRRDFVQHEQDELAPDDDVDLYAWFWSARAPESKRATSIAYHAVQCAAGHFCADHGLDVVVNLDFHRLSSAP